MISCLDDGLWSLSDAIVDPSSCALLRPRRFTLVEWVLEARKALHRDEAEAVLLAAEPDVERLLQELGGGAPGAALAPRGSPVRRVAPEAMSFDEFIERHMLGNEAVVFEEGLVARWPMVRSWCSSGSPDVGAMEASVGKDVCVPVVFRKATEARRVPFSDFAAAWRAGDPVYLKDWTFRLDGLGALAPTPPILAQFRNWLSRPHGDDYVFLYLGKQGTSTGLHADVANSFSWSANVCGRKRWKLLPVTETHLIYDHTGRHVAADFYTGSDWARCRCGRWRYFPNLRSARPVEFTQLAGEVVFVPSGAYHTVENLDDALSVNANLVNACNALWALPRLEASSARSSPSSSTFGGDNLSAEAFARRLWESIDADLAQPPNALCLFQIQRAAAIVRLLEADASRRLVVIDEMLAARKHATSLDLARGLEALLASQRRRHGVPSMHHGPGRHDARLPDEFRREAGRLEPTTANEEEGAGA